jgi:hypothetical protein
MVLQKSINVLKLLLPEYSVYTSGPNVQVDAIRRTSKNVLLRVVVEATFFLKCTACK